MRLRMNLSEQSVNFSDHALEHRSPLFRDMRKAGKFSPPMTKAFSESALRLKLQLGDANKGALDAGNRARHRDDRS
jgi:hypothetical protein